MLRRANMLVLLTTALAAGGACLIAASPALGSASQVITDCNAHGKLTRHYSATELQTALNTLPADVREYTSCVDVLQSQLQAELSAERSGGGSDPGSGGSFLPTPLIVVLVVLGLAGVTLGAIAIRRRQPPSES